MKFLFVDFTRNVFDKHPIYSLSSIVKSLGHTAEYISVKNVDSSIKEAIELNPDVCLYSCFTPEIRSAIEFDHRLKGSIKFLSMIGGPGPTFSTEEIEESSIDFFCIGEGETALEHWILNGFKAIKNIQGKSSDSTKDYFPVGDLNSFPFPDRSIVYEKDSLLRVMPAKQFMAGRGCPYRCTYCHNHILMEEFKDAGPKFRYKEVDYIIDEILDVREKYPLEKIVFQDDVFILNKPWLEEFAEKFPKRVGLPFACNVRANLINEKIVALLKKAGCESVSWSIESGNDFIRNKILLRNMSNRAILKASTLLNEAGIVHRTGNIVGIPGETFEQMLETLEINIKAKPYLAMAYTFVPFPGLALTDFAIRNGFMNESATKYLPRTFFGQSVLNFSKADKKKISNISNLFPVLVRFPQLFYNKRVFDLLISLPLFVTRSIYHLFNLSMTSKMFSVKLGIKYKFIGFFRYLESGM